MQNCLERPIQSALEGGLGEAARPFGGHPGVLTQATKTRGARSIVPSGQLGHPQAGNKGLHTGRVQSRAPSPVRARESRLVKK